MDAEPSDSSPDLGTVWQSGSRPLCFTELSQCPLWFPGNFGHRCVRPSVAEHEAFPPIKSPQLLVCFGAGRCGLDTSKQRISHWVRDAILLAYQVRGLPSPLSVRAHSTRSVASSKALFRGVPPEEICVAQEGPLRTLSSGSTTWILIRLRVLRFCLFEPAGYAVWFVSGPDRAAFLAWRVWYIVPKA